MILLGHACYKDFAILYGRPLFMSTDILFSHLLHEYIYMDARLYKTVSTKFKAFYSLRLPTLKLKR